MRKTLTSLAIAAVVTIAGCHMPEGGIMPYTGGSSTYYSTEYRPTTVSLVDTRTEEVIFSMEIPVGKQLALEFMQGEGPDEVALPDVMRYQVADIGRTSGKLSDALPVPNAVTRRIDVDYRRTPEAMPALADQPLRVDRVDARSAWWTPEGGPLPEEKARTMYDD